MMCMAASRRRIRSSQLDNHTPAHVKESKLASSNHLKKLCFSCKPLDKELDGAAEVHWRDRCLPLGQEVSRGGVHRCR